ncbi:MAG TPA: heavy metal sensor histidine kinase [Nitrospinaceae bacterium]|nr:heavy metal sensor histidine kinase [Nitrospinaceae bacterium]
MAFKSIRSRLTAWYVTLLGAILVIFSIFLDYFLSKRLYESVDNSLAVSATVVATSARMRYRSPVPGLDQIFEEFLEVRNLNKFYRIYDGSGNVGSRSSNINASQFPLSEVAYADALKGNNTYETFLVDGKHPIRVITMPIIIEKKLANLVQVGTSLDAVQGTLKNLRILLFAAVPSVLVLAALFARFMARRALKPISKIIQTARNIGKGRELSQRMPVLKIQDELGQLTLTFNEMMDRLENSFVQMRQFSSDASHELRTPLTVLKGQNELVLSKPRELEEYQDVIVSNLEEINYMSKVLEDLFILSKSDENQILLNCKRMDLRDLVDEVCKHAEVLAGEKDIRIIIACLESVKINGDEVRLRQMIWNILHNGIKYTQLRGELKVSLRDEGEFALLSIQDTGIGIPKNDLPSIFNRFYRVDKARSRDEGGSGLGLSICKYIAEAHKGRIDVESKLSVGSCFKIRIPTLGGAK